MADFDAIIAAAGGRAHLIPPRRRRDLQLAWRNVYACRLHEATGRWQRLGCDWHVFSYRHARAVEGFEAIGTYWRLSPPPRTIVCPDDGRLPALEIVGGRLPDFRGFLQDVLVWPDGLDWTMAHTHEDGWFGPYFSRRAWVEPTWARANG